MSLLTKDSWMILVTEAGHRLQDKTRLTGAEPGSSQFLEIDRLLDEFEELLEWGITTFLTQEQAKEIADTVRDNLLRNLASTPGLDQMAATSCEQDMDAVANTMEALSHLKIADVDGAHQT